LTILNDFKSYVNYAINSYKDFTDAENNAIELLYTLRQTKASLGTYQEIMKWHLSIMRRIPAGGVDKIVDTALGMVI
jgi:translation initiation factor 2B subunit (eIF-2B alpha/beta/delta family)